MLLGSEGQGLTAAFLLPLDRQVEYTDHCVLTYVLKSRLMRFMLFMNKQCKSHFHIILYLTECNVRYGDFLGKRKAFHKEHVSH